MRQPWYTWAGKKKGYDYLCFEHDRIQELREQMWIALLGIVGIGNWFLEWMNWNSTNSTLTFRFWAHASHGKPGTPPTHRPFSKHYRVYTLVTKSSCSTFLSDAFTPQIYACDIPTAFGMPQDAYF